MDGIDSLELSAQDLRELGWLHIECSVEASTTSFRVPSSSAPAQVKSAGSSIPANFTPPAPDRAAQLTFDLGADPFRQERSA
jgi:hypothetical protein